MEDNNFAFNMEMSNRRRRHIMWRVTQLIFLALAADVAVLLVEFAAGLDPFMDFQQRPVLYLYMLVGTIVAFGVFGAVLGSREALLEEMALRDSLTGLLNSRYLHARLREELASAKRHDRPTSFVLFDIDHFKKINDEYGHPVGDQVLQLIGKTMLSTIRTGEIAARVGGEEFALLLPGTPVREAAVAVERFREAIGQAAVSINNGKRIKVTVSAGVACVTDDPQDADSLYALADSALYQAKKQGRDRMIIGTPNHRLPIGPDIRDVNTSKEMT